MAPARYKDVRALVHKLLRRRKTDAAIAASNEGDFSVELAHVFHLRRRLGTHCERQRAASRSLLCGHTNSISRRRATIALKVVSLFLAMASKISSRVLLANAFELFSFLARSIKCPLTLRRRKRPSVVAKT